MTFEEIDSRLSELTDGKNADRSSKITPGSSPILGARIPDLRAIAKQIAKGDYRHFLEKYPEEYFEHETLKAFVIGYAKDDIFTILRYCDQFIPKIHDWSVNDSFCQNLTTVRNHRDTVFPWLMYYASKNSEYEQRVVAVMLMSHFLVEEYIDRVLETMDRLQFDGYYTKMGVAWCVATAMAKFPEKTLAYLESSKNQLADWTYNKSIQKMRESFRVSPEMKEYLVKLKK